MTLIAVDWIIKTRNGWCKSPLYRSNS